MKMSKTTNITPNFYRMEFVYNLITHAIGEVTCDPVPAPFIRTFLPVLRKVEAGSTLPLKQPVYESWSAEDCASLGFDYNTAQKKYLFALSGQPLANYDSTNELRRLWKSTEALYQRFNYDAPVEARITKFKEESREFLSEVRAFDCGSGAGVALMEEGADVLVTLIGLLQKRGVNLEFFLEQCEHVINKNDAKTPETHEVRDGLITRKIAPPARPGEHGYINLSSEISIDIDKTQPGESS